MAFNSAGTLYAVEADCGGTSQLITINTNNGAVAFVGASINSLDAIAFANVRMSNLPDLTVDEDTARTDLDLRQYFDDEEDGSNGLTFSIVTNTNPTLVNPAFDSANPSNMLTIHYLTNEFGEADVTVRATDSGGLYVDATMHVTVNHVEKAPVAISRVVDVFQNAPIDFNLTAFDRDGDPVTFTLMSSPTNGVLSGAPPNLTYTPNADFIGLDSFTFRADDGTFDSEEGTITLNVIDTISPRSIEENGTNVIVRFSGNPGQTFDVQFTPTLTPPHWTVLKPITIDPSGFYDLNDPATDTMRFYRIVPHQ